jgi:hypothetical protein
MRRTPRPCSPQQCGVISFPSSANFDAAPKPATLPPDPPMVTPPIAEPTPVLPTEIQHAVGRELARWAIQVLRAQRQPRHP